MAFASGVVAGRGEGVAAGDGAAAADVTITSPAWANGAGAVNLQWDLVNEQAVAQVTSFGAPSGTASITQNGAPASSITGITIGSSGELLASFGAGQVVAVAQLAIASFNNPQGRGADGNDYQFRMRGSPAGASRDFVESGVPVDPYNVEPAEVASGPNSIPFGPGPARGPGPPSGQKAKHSRQPPPGGCFA